jgi:prepilin-type N-terminal cleavage/methylation domain-containing protein
MKKAVKVTMQTCPAEMRIKVTARRCGFTLVEAMVALVIASLMVGMTMLNLQCRQRFVQQPKPAEDTR